MNPITLTVLNGPSKGRIVSSMESPYMVGRASAADFSIMDPRMSRKHFVLDGEAESWQIRDLESANGTLVNGERTTAAMTLTEGDVITAGDTRFCVAFGVAQADPVEETLLLASEQAKSRRSTWSLTDFIRLS